MMENWQNYVGSTADVVVHRLLVHSREPNLTGNVAVVPQPTLCLEPLSPEVDAAGFYGRHLTVRFAGMLWAGTIGTPAMQTRPLFHGKRLDFVKRPESVAIANGSDVSNWSTVTRQPHRVRHREWDVYCLCSVPHSHRNLALGTSKGPIVLRFEKRRGMEDFKDVMEYDVDGLPVDCLDFHPGGFQFVTAGPNRAGFDVWDYATKSRRRITTRINRITRLSYAPNGNYIAAVSDRRWVLIYATVNWTCVRLGAQGIEAEIRSMAWSTPTNQRGVLIVALSNQPYLELCEVLMQNNAISMHRISLTSTAAVLSMHQPAGDMSCVREMCWDTYGRRLAVMMDHPHPKAGYVALFMTHLTQEPEFLGYVYVVREITFTKSVEMV